MTRKGLGESPRPLPFVRQLKLICLLLLVPMLVFATQTAETVKRITWDDVAPVRPHLAKHKITAETFASYVDRTHVEDAKRVRLGDLDHLIFYILQSRQFTKLATIEPALSAKALVDALDEKTRQAYLRGDAGLEVTAPRSAIERIEAYVLSLNKPAADARTTFFRDLVTANFPSKADRRAALTQEYLRAMRFVYEKEFVAQRAKTPAEAVAELYRSRGLSTDTAVEAGFIVYNGLGIASGLDPDRRIRRVLIVGPGLDLAPRTALLEDAPPQSYQPWAVLDALAMLKMSELSAIEIVGADINPRVVDHLTRSRANPPQLRLTSELRESDEVTISNEFREYFGVLGKAIGESGAVQVQQGHLTKPVRVSAAASQTVSGQSLDIVTDRLDGKPFDLVIATNILPYFDDAQLALALTNIAAMLAPGGLFLHNERRPIIGDLGESLGLKFEQARYVTIATVRNGPPLFDSAFLHRKTAARASPLAAR